MEKILVTYYSKTGSTKEIAERIGKNLTEKGLENDVLNMSEVKDLKSYSKFVLGSPINGMKMAPDFMKFIKENEVVLKGRVLGIFPVAYIYYDGRPFWRRAMNKNIAKVEKILEPEKSSKVFSGRVPDKMPALMRFMFGISNDIPLDLVKLEEVDKWCEELI